MPWPTRCASELSCSTVAQNDTIASLASFSVLKFLPKSLPVPMLHALQAKYKQHSERYGLHFGNGCEGYTTAIFVFFLLIFDLVEMVVLGTFSILAFYLKMSDITSIMQQHVNTWDLQTWLTFLVFTNQVGSLIQLGSVETKVRRRI